MARRCVKYLTACVAFTVFAITWFLTQNRAINKTNGWNLNFASKAKSAEDNVKKIMYFKGKGSSLRNELLEHEGKFNDSDVSTIKTTHIKGLSHFISPENLWKEAKETSLTNRSLIFSSLSDRRKVRNVSCLLLFQGTNSENIRAKSLIEKYSKIATSAEMYSQMTGKCSSFIKKRGYITESLTALERDFPIAYSVLMYKDVEQSERLLRAIYRPQNTYCIHVDSKSADNIFSAMSNIANCFENVFILNKRFNVQWGTMTVLEPELLCMSELRKKGKHWKYFVNLTGQEFPLKTNYELVKILKAYNGSNDIEGVVKGANRERWTNAGTPPHSIVPTKGAVHIVVSRGYVDFILDDQRAKDFLNWTSHTVIPDETFFATLNHNPFLRVLGSYKGYPETEMKDNIKPYVARFKNWGSGHFDWPCKGKWVRHICVFGIGDLPLLASRRELFANKFFLDYQQFTLDCMEELLFNRTRDEYLGKLTFNATWYSKLGFVFDKVD